MHLCALGIACLLDLVGPLLGKSNTEKTEKEAISGPYINIGFNECLPLLDHGAKFVSGEVHAMEVGQNVAALDLLSNELELAECNFICLKISQRHFEDTSFQSIGSDFCSLGSCDKSFADLTDVEHGWGLDIVPIFFGEWVNNLFLGALFATFSEPFILADRHVG